jgi:hypothetical protein
MATFTHGWQDPTCPPRHPLVRSSADGVEARPFEFPIYVGVPWAARSAVARYIAQLSVGAPACRRQSVQWQSAWVMASASGA